MTTENAEYLARVVEEQRQQVADTEAVCRDYEAWIAEACDALGVSTVFEFKEAGQQRERAEAQLAKAVAVVRFYANAENWKAVCVFVAPEGGPNPGASMWESGPANDGGKRARAFLVSVESTEAEEP